MHSSRADDSAHSRAVAAQPQPILVYDGSCGLCTRAMMWLARHTATDTIAFLASQELDTTQLADLGLTRDQVNTSVWWIVGDSCLSGHAAIGAALASSRSRWRYLGRLIDVVPFRLIAPSAYRLIARNRHLLPGATQSCRSVTFRADVDAGASERL